MLCGSLTHSPSGSAAAATGPHVPLGPEPFFTVLHASHSPPHAVSQQKPSTQNPLAHWLAALHVAPGACFGRHCEPLQKCPVAQSASRAHAVAQVPLVALQKYAPHAVPLTVPQVRAPVHCCGRLSLATHVALPQVVPTAHVSHAPLPLQAPL